MSESQESQSILAKWSWFRASHEVTTKLLAGAAGSDLGHFQVHWHDSLQATMLFTGCPSPAVGFLATWASAQRWPPAFPRVSSQPVPTMEVIVVYGLIFLTVCSWSHRATLLRDRGLHKSVNQESWTAGGHLGGCLPRKESCKMGFFLAANPHTVTSRWGKSVPTEQNH